MTLKQTYRYLIIKIHFKETIILHHRFNKLNFHKMILQHRFNNLKSHKINITAYIL